MSQNDPPLAQAARLAATPVVEAVRQALTQSGVEVHSQAGSAVQFGPVTAPALFGGRLFGGEALLAAREGELRFESDRGATPHLALRWQLQLSLRQLFWPVVIALPLALTGSFEDAVLAAISVFLALGVGESLLALVRTPRYLRRLVATEADLVVFRRAHGLPTPGRAV